MSWIVRDLWRTLEEREGEYLRLLEERRFQGFEAVNRIAVEVGSRWNVFLQVNFPPGSKAFDLQNVGHQNLTMLVYRERKKFERVSEQELRQAFTNLDPVSFDPAGFGYEGFRVKIPSGRIDCLPGGVHLWCEISMKVLEFLDWLFVHEYGLKPVM